VATVSAIARVERPRGVGDVRQAVGQGGWMRAGVAGGGEKEGRGKREFVGTCTRGSGWAAVHWYFRISDDLQLKTRSGIPNSAPNTRWRRPCRNRDSEHEGVRIVVSVLKGLGWDG
jgi:hypothetical protein